MQSGLVEKAAARVCILKVKDTPVVPVLISDLLDRQTDFR